MLAALCRVGLVMVALLTASALIGQAGEPGPRHQLLDLNNITGTDVIEGKVAALVKDADATHKLLERAVAMLKEKEQPFNYNALYILARAAQQLKEADSAEQLYRQAVKEALKLQSGRDLVQSIGGLIDLFYVTEKYDETIALCREFLMIQGNEAINRVKPAVVERLVQALVHQKKVDQALKLLDKLVKAEEEHGGWWFLQVKARAQREAERFDESRENYETVLERIGKDKTLTAEEKSELSQRVRYLLSDVYTQLNQIDKATEQLELLLKEKPDEPSYNNDLGYLWADHDLNLDRAEKLIRKAIKEARKRRRQDAESAEDDKADAGYLDSLGWVLFKKKQYEQAKKYLLEAVKDKEGQDVEIYDHLGEVYRALGEEEEAQKIFQKAIDTAGSSAHEQKRKAEVEEKLKKASE